MLSSGHLIAVDDDDDNVKIAKIFHYKEIHKNVHYSCKLRLSKLFEIYFTINLDLMLRSSICF